MPTDFPNVNDAVKDYQQSIFCIIQEIGIEYQRMFQGEEAGAESTNGGATGTVKNAASMNNQVREVRE